MFRKIQFDQAVISEGMGSLIKKKKHNGDGSAFYIVLELNSFSLYCFDTQMHFMLVIY